MGFTSDDYWKYLIVALLSVNQYKLSKTYLKINELEIAGLFIPSNLVEWNQEKIIEKLIEAQCDRGEFMNNIFSSRIKEIGNTINVYGQTYCEQIFASQDKEKIKNFLIGIKGVGKVVIDNFFILVES
jgi:hypothetical protein